MRKGDKGSGLAVKQDISGIFADVIEAVDSGHTIPVTKLNEILRRISNSAAPVNDVFIKFLKILFWYQQTDMLNYLFTNNIECIINHCNEIKVLALFVIEPFINLDFKNPKLKLELMDVFQKVLGEVAKNPYQIALVMTGLLEQISPGKTYLSYILQRKSQILIPLFLNEGYPLFAWLDSLGEQSFVELLDAFLQHDLLSVSFSRDVVVRCILQGPPIQHAILLNYPHLFCVYYLLRPVPSLPLPDTWVSQPVASDKRVDEKLEYYVLFPGQAQLLDESAKIALLYNWVMQLESATTLAKRHYASVTARFLLNVLDPSFGKADQQQNYLCNVFNQIIEQLSDPQLLEGLENKFEVLLLFRKPLWRLRGMLAHHPIG